MEQGMGQRWPLKIAIVLILFTGWVYFSTSDLRKVVPNRYPGQIALIVGGGGNITHAGPSYSNRTYVLIPLVFQTLKVVTVERVNGNAPTISEAWTTDLILFFIILLLAIVSITRKRIAQPTATPDPGTSGPRR